MDDDHYVVTASGMLNGKMCELYSVRGIEGYDLAKEKGEYFAAFYKDRGIDVTIEIKEIGSGK